MVYLKPAQPSMAKRGTLILLLLCRCGADRSGWPCTEAWHPSLVRPTLQNSTHRPSFIWTEHGDPEGMTCLHACGASCVRLWRGGWPPCTCAAAQRHRGSSWEGERVSRLRTPSHRDVPHSSSGGPREGLGCSSGGRRFRAGSLSSQVAKERELFRHSSCPRQARLPEGAGRRVGTGGPAGLCLMPPGSSPPSAASNTAQYPKPLAGTH